METAATGHAPGDAALDVLRANAALIQQQIGLARNERFRNRIKAVRDIALAAGALMLAVGAGSMVWSAAQAKGLVIQPLSTPPDLVERGLTGAALASQLLDRLALLQASTDSSRAASTYANNWEGDISVEIPSTGVSIDELSRWLRRELGHETQITGEVVRDGAALTMTVRAGAEGGRATRIEDGDLEGLIQASAETIYEQTQPYRYSQYLRANGRIEESLQVATRLAATGSPTDRAWANIGLGVIREDAGDLRGAIALYRRALAARPDLALAWNNLARCLQALGDDEGSLEALRSAERHIMGRGRADYDDNSAQLIRLRIQSDIAEALGDPTAAARLDAQRSSLVEYAGNVAAAPMMQARHLAQAHDVSGAWRVLRANGIVDPAAAQRRDISFPARILAPSALAHMAVGDWNAAVRDFETIDAVATEQSRFPAAARTTTLWPFWAEALARANRIAEAEVRIARTPEDCYACQIGRGIVLALKGDAAASDRWFARAVRKAPSVPRAYSAWGEAKLARGDRDGAIALFRQAAKTGPRWADPLKLWGDALLSRGDVRGAIRRYAAAAERAPRWGGLQVAWGRALQAQGRSDEAREKYRAAAAMDLSVADQAEGTRRMLTANIRS